MILKSLEINGFKTFADKTELGFGEGITAIVGPNGSGKSNITDALRWVLGEQSSKTLRQNRMEEMIFAGSASRKPMGMAEVTAVFDNSDRTLPLEFDEVAITRRIYRDGASQFLLNKSAQRLKDIQEIFMGTGLGKGTISIISEREAGLVLSPDPMDRRIILEEVAGVNRFRMRKREAQRKLEATRANLQRLADILYEVESQKKDAKLQVGRLEKYNRYQERLREIKTALLLDEMKKELLGKQEILARQKDVSEKFELLKTSLHEEELKFSEILEVADKKEEQWDAVRSRLEELRMEEELLEREAGMLNSRKESHEKRKARIKEQRASLTDESALAERVESAFKSYNEAKDALSAFEEEFKIERNRIREQITTHDGELSSLLTRGGEVSARLSSISEDSRQAQARLARLSAEIESISIRQSELEKRSSKGTEQKGDLEKEADDLKKQVEHLTKKEEDLSSLISTQSSKLRTTEDAHRDIFIRLEKLLGLEKERIGYSEAIRKLMKNREKWPELLGVVADMIQVRPGYEEAVEAALSERVQDIAVRDKTNLAEIGNFLNSEKAGRAAFWPLDLERKIKNSPAGTGYPEGVITDIISLVTCPDELRPVMETILSDAVIANDLDTALALYNDFVSRNVPAPLVVTGTGEVVTPEGRVILGGKEESDKLLSRKREKAALENALREKEAALEKAREEVTVRIAERERCEKERREISTQLLSLSRSLNGLEAELSKEKIQHSMLSERIEQLAKDKGELERNVASLPGLQRSLEAEKNSNTKKAEELRTVLAEERSGLQKLEEKRESLRTGMNLKSQEYMLASQKIEDNKREAGRLAEEEAALLEEDRDMEVAARQIELRHGQIKSESDQLKSKEELAHNELKDILARKKNIQDGLAEIRKETEEVRETLYSIQVSLAGLDARLTSYTQRAGELGINIENIVWEELEEIEREKLENDSSRLSKFIESFGSVNLGAKEDFERLSERAEFLSGQIMDLEGAASSLEKIMGEMDALTGEQFLETFRKVSAEFSETFRALFGGGKGSLELVDPGNVLESGVNISVKPPGKKLQNITSLSSGERALSAIAFLLSLLKVKASPFVLIDEMDAALDDVNVEKVVDRFVEFSRQSQFIIITHNRRTMECAGRLYGITMQESGVSKVVSVTLTERDATLAPLEAVTE
ncbi:MAG: chromosome segregation protein SMC [Chloroflexi bacterium]|nr:chromosome segregation protein SMC [Chloroflexota bacterium]